MTGLFPDEAADRREHARRQDDSTPGQMLPTMREFAAIMALASMAFTVGYNWKEVTTLRADYDRHIVTEDRMHDTLTLREVSNAQYLEIQRQLNELSRMIEQIRDRKR